MIKRMAEKIDGGLLFLVLLVSQFLCNWVVFPYGLYPEDKFIWSNFFLLLWFLAVCGLSLYVFYKKREDVFLLVMGCWWAFYVIVYILMLWLQSEVTNGLGWLGIIVIALSSSVFYGLHPFVATGIPAVILTMGFGVFMAGMAFWLHRKLMKEEKKEGEVDV